MVKLVLQEEEMVEDEVPGLLQSKLWLSLEGAEGLLNSALPNLKCPICGSQSFQLIRDFAGKASPRTEVYGWQEKTSLYFIPTLTLSCNECGHFISFAEEELLRRAERKNEPNPTSP